MGNSRPWWKRRRVMHRDAVGLCILSSSFLLAGEMTNPVLLGIYSQYLEPVMSEPPVFVLRATLAVFGFTTAFGGLLVFLGGWYFLRGKVARGRFLVGFGVGLTALTLLSRIAYYTLVFGSPMEYLLPLAHSLAGLGVLFGFAAHTAMGKYALLLKQHAWTYWRRWRRARFQGEPYPLRPYNRSAFAAPAQRTGAGRRG